MMKFLIGVTVGTFIGMVVTAVLLAGNHKNTEDEQ